MEYVRFLFQAARSLMSAEELRVYKEEFERRYIHGQRTKILVQSVKTLMAKKAVSQKRLFDFLGEDI